MADNLSLGSINLGLGGLGDALDQQVKDEDEERKRKLLQAGRMESRTASTLGLNTLNLLGGYDRS